MVRLIIPKLCGACFFALLIILSPLTAYADTSPEDVKQAAQNGLPVFLNAIPRGDLEHYGFNNKDELDIATLGEPYKVYTLTPQSLQSYKKGKKLLPLISETNSWYFPVMVKGEARTILTVSFLEGTWQAADIGGLALPQRLQRLGVQLPTLLEEKEVSGGYSTKFVRIFPWYLDFMVVDSYKGEFVIPLLAHPDWLGVENNKLYAPEDIMPKVAESVQRALESEGEMGGGGLTASAPEKEDNGRTVNYVAVLSAVVLVGLAIGLLKAKRVL